eukprot:TRINITY_DN11702_c0_g1_i1.p1 TRINITY_DN11702_c0_g1~~TRINITY_DN11702_c0_g1_i1.p1  ORF type:complete len:220 (-),score=32.52 TRINITY_DN11702_c0_g1_i1:78-737(-)
MSKKRKNEELPLPAEKQRKKNTPSENKESSPKEEKGPSTNTIKSSEEPSTNTIKSTEEPATHTIKSANDLYLKAREIIQESVSGLFYSYESEFGADARLVTPILSDDMTLSFFTNSTTSKQVSSQPLSLMTFSQMSKGEYVVLHGKSKLNDDVELKKKLWSKDHEPFYPDGVETKDLSVFEFKPERIELVSCASHIADDPKVWSPAKIILVEDKWECLE